MVYITGNDDSVTALINPPAALNSPLCLIIIYLLSRHLNGLLPDLYPFDGLYAMALKLATSPLFLCLSLSLFLLSDVAGRYSTSNDDLLIICSLSTRALI